MAASERIRRQRLLSQAEGYLELGMPRHALEVLSRYGDPESLSHHALYLQGEALRELGRFREAIEPLGRAARANPTNLHVWLALGWCHKRNGRIDLAIESLEEALTVEPNEALIYYNLACYWAIAANKRQALGYLSRAFDLKEDYRAMVADEADFDSLRNDPGFQELCRVTV